MNELSYLNCSWKQQNPSHKQIKPKALDFKRQFYEFDLKCKQDSEILKEAKYFLYINIIPKPETNIITDQPS